MLNIYSTEQVWCSGVFSNTSVTVNVYLETKVQVHLTYISLTHCKVPKSFIICTMKRLFLCCLTF